MKVAITGQGPGVDAQVDPQFGRAKYVVVLDTETGEVCAADNTKNLNASRGAGIQAGRSLVERGVEAVVTGQIGPKALATLEAAGVRVYTGASGTVSDAAAQLRSGRLVCQSTARGGRRGA